MEKQCCKDCENWIDGTAECAVYLKNIANGWIIIDSMNVALELDAHKENNCEEFC